MNTLNLSNSYFPVVVLPCTIKPSYSSHMEALYHMDQQGVCHLGWLNDGITVPSYYCFKRVYSNYSGSSCLYVDPYYRVAYSVDMGD
jgi:hypothetical protein